jgi:4-alpha-glucanotransferase
VIPPPLGALADLYGVEQSYVDTDGARQVADPDALVAVLRSLGADLTAPGGAAGPLRTERVRRSRQVLAPVLTWPPGSDPDVELTLPAARALGECWLHVEAEDGSTTTSRPMVRGPVSTVDIEGAIFHVYPVSLLGPEATPLPAGYHHLTIETATGRSTALVVVAPPCPRPSPGWGAFMPVHALRSAGDRGVGTYADLARLTGWIAGQGGSFVGTLPLYPAFLDESFEPSPYVPVTRLGWNELFVDPRLVPEFGLTPGAQDLMGERPAAGPGADGLVDYRSTMERLRRILEPMAANLFAGPSGRRDALDSFAASRPELVRYAEFRGAHERGEVAALGRAELVEAPPVHALSASARYHLYVQWIAESQVQAAGDRLYLDMPVGVHPDGFDPWWEPDAFARGVEGGAPPDDFFASGQQWGFRPLDPRVVRADGYRYPIACLRHLMRRASRVRIDHVMGLHRLFWIPDGFSARHGVYVRYHLEEMAAIVSLEADRSGTSVVGEDLGTVPDVVRLAMGESRILRSWVLEFEATATDPLPEPPESAMASIGTHDLPRFATFWDGEDIDDLVARGAQTEEWARPEHIARRAWRDALVARIGLDPGVAGPAGASSALRLCLTHLAASPARLMLVDLEDLWLERRPVNRPGSGPELPNWRTRSRRTLEELTGDPAIAELLGQIQQQRRLSRAPLGSGDEVSVDVTEGVPG